MAGEAEDPDARFRRPVQGFAEGGIRRPVGQDFGDTVHLDHKGDHRPVPFLHGFRQLPQVLCTALRGCVRKVAGAFQLDFYMRRGAEEYLMEVKGCTLELEGIGYFPDAPTERGTKHLRELTEAVKKGYRAVIAFVIQMDGITEVLPHRTTDPAFGESLDRAAEAGVRILCLPCHVEPDRLEIVSGPL